MSAGLGGFEICRPCSESEDTSSEGSDENALELMPILRATGHRVLSGIAKHGLLERCALGFSVYEETLTPALVQSAALACRRLKAAKPKAKKGAKYSAGQTYWVGFQDEPHDILEKLAKEIFAKHTTDIDFEEPPIQKELCGAEYWAVVCHKDDDVAPHFDKCYCLEESHKINLHPLIGTVTYLTGVGAPTVITGVSEDYIPCFRAGDASHPQKERKVSYAVSFPKPGKHITFDGQLLHFANSELALEGRVEGSERVALLVNVWVNYKPKDAERLTRIQQNGTEPQQLMDFGTRGEIGDAEPLKPQRKLTIRGGGLWFSGFFVDAENTSTGGTLWYDGKFCIDQEDEDVDKPAPKKRKKLLPKSIARKRQLRKEAEAREARQEVLALIECGLAVDDAQGFLTTAFVGRNAQRPEGMA